ncbi:uncharacterized protein MYCGRDRAFT_71110 [Zymoseptoria tritici IPO323]|uniref:Ubiquitin-like domain-containing protein n=1 Tax=Zymoseptoria tritici (strain CBS 115943 / IPO323) TaxID=336722 RepID=F9XA57_ZYMTI|nr:uncharacterized protein MYCGRDRAFT_71110 [Zymoseptoria tritici IPO323]EGP87958.1 hypothetical protein MYCGRDRAFT_71110 [Zymoseptoria tritici IPO323]
MADDNTATTADDSEQQITFNVKSSADAKYVVTVSAAITVGDLKQKLSTSEYADLPPERQRLIYSGRVLKDADTVGSCKIKDGNTVHLVKGAESNQRQNPANQGGAAAIPSAPGQPASNVPTNIAAGSGTGNPLAQLTGARYAGFHGLPGADTFGADGGMGAPPNPDQMLRMLDDPNFAQQMNEAMNNPAVLDMLRNNPMIRNNPMARAAIENPEMRRMMMDPNVLHSSPDHQPDRREALWKTNLPPRRRHRCHRHLPPRHPRRTCLFRRRRGRRHRSTVSHISNTCTPPHHRLQRECRLARGGR